MEKIDLAVIIPCFNGKNYIKTCLQSLEKQKIKLNEIIIVDDCSTDESYEYVQEYIRNSSLPVSLYRNEVNCGPGKSRANGVAYVHSRYVTFCDSDDWYEEDFTYQLSKVLNSDEDLDLVIIGNYFCSETGEKRNNTETGVLCGKAKMEIMARCQMSLCRLVTKTSTIEKVDFPGLYHAEDGVVATQIIALSKKMSIIDIPLYNYLVRAGSASTKPSPDTFREFESAYNIIAEKLASQYPKEIEFIGVKYICYGAVLNAFKCDLSNKEITDMVERFELKNPNWYKNQYCKSLSRAKRVYTYAVRKKLWPIVRLLTKIHTRLVK